jgi:hypothetical protein
MAETVPIQQLFGEMSIGDDPFDGMRLADAFFDRRTEEWRRSECGITDRDYTLFMARVPRIRLLKQAIPPSVWDEVTAKATGAGGTQRQRMDSMAGALADCLIHEDVSEELACCTPVDRTFGESADIAYRLVMIVEACRM